MSPPSSRRIVLAAGSMSFTSAISTRVFCCFLRMWRIGAAMAGADRPAVATWESSGWNRGWLVRSITLSSTGASPGVCAAHRPPKPQPMTTSRGAGVGLLAFNPGVLPQLVPLRDFAAHRGSEPLGGRAHAFGALLEQLCLHLGQCYRFSDRLVHHGNGLVGCLCRREHCVP